jgi:hypothetical protein
MFARGLFLLVWLFITGGIGAVVASQASAGAGVAVFLVLIVGGVFLFERRQKT